MLTSCLVMGVSRSGKTYCIKDMMQKLIDETDARLMVIDPKRFELRKFKKHPRVERYTNDPDGAIELLRSANRILEQRSMELEDAPEDQDEYEGAPLYVIVDETAALLEQNKEQQKEAIRLIYNISFLGKALKVFLILGTQQTRVETIPSKIMNNVSNKVVFKTDRKQDGTKIIDTNAPYFLTLDSHMCYVKSENDPTPTKMNGVDVYRYLTE